MFDLDSKKAEKGGEKLPPDDQDVGLDIENALSFIDSEEYKEGSAPVQHKNPSTPSKESEKRPVRAKESPAGASPGHEPPRPRKVQETPAQKPISPPKAVEGTKTGKMWILWVGIAVMIVIITVFYF